MPTDERVLVIPKGQFYSQTNGKWVFVVKGGKAVRRPITTGRDNPDYYEVLGGLKPGTRYVAEQSFLIKADVDKSGASHDH